MSNFRAVVVPRSQAEAKLNQYIEAGRTRSAVLVNQLAEEAERRRDYIVPISRLTMTPEPQEDGTGGIVVTMRQESGDRVWHATDHARAQILTDHGIPSRFWDGLLHEPKGVEPARKLIADLAYRSGRRFVRTVDDQLKGWLSDSYKPIDTADSLMKFGQTVTAGGALLTDGRVTDCRFSLTAVLPVIHEPIPNEFILVGLTLRSSDYGAGAVSVAFNLLRIICTNLAIGETLFRQVHLGGKDDGRWENATNYEVSGRTRRLSSAANVSAMADAVKFALGEENVRALVDGYRQSATETINVEKGLKGLREKGVIGQTDEKFLGNMIESNENPEILPVTDATNSKLRFAQALAWLANNEKGEKALKLNEAAGSIVRAA